MVLLLDQPRNRVGLARCINDRCNSVERISSLRPFLVGREVQHRQQAKSGTLVLLLKSAKGSDAAPPIRKELARPSGGALDTATVLRVFVRRKP
jgi:hypothetical protein